MKLKVLRSFLWAGKVVKVDEIFEIDSVKATDLISSGKAIETLEVIEEVVEPQPKLKELYTKACENYEKRKSQSSSPSDTGNDSDTSGGSPE